MAYEEKPGTGAIFKNNKLKDTHPEYRGSIITPSGEKLDVSLWVKESKAGTKYFSAAIQEPYKKQEPAAAQYASEPPANDSDDLPF